MEKMTNTEILSLNTAPLEIGVVKDAKILITRDMNTPAGLAVIDTLQDKLSPQA